MARRNIPYGQCIKFEDVVEVGLPQSEVPPEAVLKKEEIPMRPALGVGVGQIVVLHHYAFGRHEGLSVNSTGFQPLNALINDSDLAAGAVGVINFKGDWVINPKYSEIHYAPKFQSFWVTDLKHQLPEEKRSNIEKSVGHTLYVDTWIQLDRDGNDTGNRFPWGVWSIKWPSRFYRENELDFLWIKTKTGW